MLALLARKKERSIKVGSIARKKQLKVGSTVQKNKVKNKNEKSLMQIH